jgi:Xaa-Pro aminopeptidase
MTAQEVAWLNAYHRRVYRTLSPAMDEPAKTWLAEATRPI